MKQTLHINRADYQLEAESSMSVMSALRNVLGLTGTKYGCAIGECGACTINIDGKAIKSCQMTLEEVGDKPIETIEGFAAENPDHAILKAWRELEVSQCGYCQPGMIMASVDLLKNNINPSREEIAEALDGICRCGTYPRIFDAVERAAAQLRGETLQPLEIINSQAPAADMSHADYRSVIDSQEKTFQPHPWVAISISGRTTIFGPAAELGQGGMTAVPLMFAEEFDADWDNVIVCHSPIDDDTFGNPVYWAHRIMITVGSSTTPNYFMDARRKGAIARRVMIEAAANKWNVDPNQLETEPGIVVDPSTGKRLSYGDIAAFADTPASLPEITDEQLKDSASFRLIGHNAARPDLHSKLDGSAKYAIDVALPEMAFARLLRPPVKNAKAALFSDEETRNLPGVTVVELPDGYGVVADNYELAWYGAHSLQIDWADAEGSLFDDQIELNRQMEIAKDISIVGFPMQNEGDFDEAFGKAENTLTAEYKTDFVYHGAIEPLAAVARWSSDESKLEIWAGTQSPSHAMRALAKAFELPEDQITLHRTYMGGGFGRRAAMDQDWIIDTARLAKAVKRPVKLIYAREDDMAFGRFKPITAHALRGVLDNSGQLTALHHRIVSDEPLTVSDPWRYAMNDKFPITSHPASPIPYAMDSRKVDIVKHKLPVRISPMRGVGGILNTFARESFIDELALREKKDPLAYRLEMTNNEIGRSVIDRLAELCDWHNHGDRVLGMAYVDCDEVYVATAIEIEKPGSTGQLTVKHIYIAADAGRLILPYNANAQLEGAVLFALSNSLCERITFKEGAVQQTNFDTYRMLKMHDTPAMTYAYLPSQRDPKGIGDIVGMGVSAALANALATLTGRRIRHLPLTPERVLSALSS